VTGSSVAGLHQVHDRTDATFASETTVKWPEEVTTASHSTNATTKFHSNPLQFDCVYKDGDDYSANCGSDDIRNSVPVGNDSAAIYFYGLCG
jgi:hypothetical protein